MKSIRGHGTWHHIADEMGDRANAPRKTAESTGIFPPTPTLETAVSDASAMNVPEPPIAIPNILPMNNVRLNGHLPTERIACIKQRRGRGTGTSPTFYPRYHSQNSRRWHQRVTLYSLQVRAKARCSGTHSELGKELGQSQAISY
jgi:hypothetical protein